MNRNWIFSAIAAVAVATIVLSVWPASAQTRTRGRLHTPWVNTYGRRAVDGAIDYDFYANRAALYQQSVQPNTSALPPVSGPVTPYSDVEYGQIVQMMVNAARQNTPAPNAARTVRMVDMGTTKTPAGQTLYAPLAMTASQVLDRGVLLFPTGEEVRLRGVDMPSKTASNEVLRVYATEGARVLSQLTTEKPLSIILDDPLRDSSGRILATVVLPDGTELNKRMLEMGYGSLKGEDFALGVDYSDLKAAEDQAKAQRAGIWSRR